MKVYLDKTIFHVKIDDNKHKDVVFKGWYEIERENCYPDSINVYHKETGKLFHINNNEIMACKGDLRSNEYYSKFTGKFRWGLTKHDAILAILAEKDCGHCFWNQWKTISKFKTEDKTEVIDDNHRIWYHTIKSIDEKRCTYGDHSSYACTHDAEAASLELYVKPCDYVTANLIRSFKDYVRIKTKCDNSISPEYNIYMKHIDTYALWLDMDTNRIYYRNAITSFDFPATKAEIMNWDNYSKCLNKKSREKIAKAAKDFLFYDKLEEKWNQYVESNKEIFDFVNENKL